MGSNRLKLLSGVRSSLRERLSVRAHYSLTHSGYLSQLENGLSILRQLEEMEQRSDIHIVYAVESGPRDWSLDSADSIYDVRFLYIRRDDNGSSSSCYPLPPSETSTEPVRVVRSQSRNNRHHLTGYDLNVALALLMRMHPPVVDMFYSSKVYKVDEEHAADFGERVRRAIERPARPVQLLKSYRAMSCQNYALFVENKSLVSLRDYMMTVRHMLTFQWLYLCHSSLPQLNDDERPDSRFVETDFDVLLGDFKTHNAVLHTYSHVKKLDLFNSISGLGQLMRELGADHRVERVASVDDWITHMCDQPFDFMLEKSDANDAAELQSTLDDVFRSLVKSFD